MTVKVKQGKRFDTIDLMRGLSIIAVVLLHVALRFSMDADLSLQPQLPTLIGHLLLQQGGNGVTIFFAISGFLITYTSIKRFRGLAGIKPAVFYRIRFARIGPPLLLLLTILSVLHLSHVEGFVIRPAVGHLSGALLSVLTFTYSWYEARYGWLPACWTVLWSLSIEEMFYLFFPLTCVLFLHTRHLDKRTGQLLWIGLLLALVIMAPFGRTVWAATEHGRENSYLGGMGPIALGCLTALLTVRLSAKPARRAVLFAVEALGILLIAWMVCWPRWHWIRPVMHRLAVSDTDDFVLPLGVCLVMFASVLRGQTGSRFTAPIRWFGRHSYEVYLSHEFLVIAGVDLYLAVRKHHAPGPLVLWFAAILLATAPPGWLIAKLFSEPLNRLLRQPVSAKKRAVNSVSR